MPLKTAGIIAEFNPFHEGHRLLLDKARKSGAETLLVVMSGNFVQRGEPALLPKAYRAEAALRLGADLVAELPLPWAMSGAETFARGGVSLLSSLQRMRLGCSPLENCPSSGNNSIFRSPPGSSE